MKNLLICCFIAIMAVSIVFITCSPTEPENPQLSVNPTSCAFTKNVNTETLIISNSGGGELSWEITDKPDWLEASKSSGKVTTGIDTVIITADISQAAGTYSGTININSNGGNQVVNISLDISLWIKKKNMPTARFGLATSVVDGRVYAIGGGVGVGDMVRKVQEYNPATDSWVEKANMPTATCWHSTSAVDGRIYAIGGWHPSGGIDTVEEYYPATDTWRARADMPTPRWFLSTSVVNGKIYAIGGAEFEHGLGTVEEYDPTTNTWTTKVDMPTPRILMSTSVVDGIIYAIGGARWPHAPTLSIVEAYNPATDTWTTKTPMPSPRVFFSTSVVNGKIYAIGGCADEYDEFIASVEIYDPVTDTWTQTEDLPTPRKALATSAVNGNIYAIGGDTGSAWFDCVSTVEEYDSGNEYVGHEQRKHAYCKN